MIKPLTAQPIAAGVAMLAMLLAAPALAQVRTNTRAPLPAPAAAQPQPSNGTPPATGDVARTAFIQSMDAEFRKRDLDSDGKVTRSEVEQFERNATLAKAQAENRALFASLDKDRNGQLSAGEFAALVRNNPVLDVSAQMQRFDTNRDQIISLVEYRTATLLNFDRLDADKDGVVTERELAAAAPSTQSNGMTGR